MNKFGAIKTEVDGRGLPWTPQEDELLIELRLARRSIPQAANVLGRSADSVENRWLRLRKARSLPRVRGSNIADHEAHFWSRVDQSGGPDACWPWAGNAKYLSGYGVATFDMGDGRKNYGTHRIAFFLKEGRPQSPGLHVMHACDNPVCCNPAHLSEGTRSENMRDAYARGRMDARKPIRGEEHHRATLTEVQVAAIRRLKVAGAKRRDIAEALGLSLGAIDNITSGRSWRAVA